MGKGEYLRLENIFGESCGDRRVRRRNLRRDKRKSVEGERREVWLGGTGDDDRVDAEVDEAEVEVDTEGMWVERVCMSEVRVECFAGIHESTSR